MADVAPLFSVALGSGPALFYATKRTTELKISAKLYSITNRSFPDIEREPEVECRQGGLLLLSAAFVGLAVLASNEVNGQTVTSPVQSSTTNSVQRVEVIGLTKADDRRESNASKVVLTREDLTRYGDTTLTDALQRISGVSVKKIPGKDTEIRIRGLGNGYTQILIDGQPAPSGFLLESLSPDVIDRVEILRSATADMSAQSIAGTLNIILKRAGKKTPPQLKIGIGHYRDATSANASVDYSDRSGALSYGLSLNGNIARDNWPTLSTVAAKDGEGAPLFGRITRSDERNEKLTLALTPRLNWKASETDSFSLSGLVQSVHVDYGAREDRATLFGTPPDFASDSLTSADNSTLARLTANWKSSLGADARLESKLIFSTSRRSSEAQFNGYALEQSPLLYRTIHSVLTDMSASLAGKYSLNVGENHTLAAGGDGQLGRRSENRIQVETSPTSYPTESLNESYTAEITRLAVFAQNEWSVSKQLSMYGGIRWEGLRTRTTGNVLDAVRTQSSVLSPTFQLLWKIPDTRSDQLRLSLGRTYKAPTARELIPRRYVVGDNTATTPNFQGNPALLPELSWGIDAGYERYLERDGFLGINLYAKRVQNVVLQ
jgi:outer membrane receptor protein involved in Fe transport